MKYSSKHQGFTIVELLIVIVVIAILAAISIAAYTNIQQRAKNTAIINAASQSLKMIEAYIAANGDYPVASWACITEISECQAATSTEAKLPVNATFKTNMATIGILPKNVPTEGDRLYGISYIYTPAARFNGDVQPAFLRYFLVGKNQQCGLPGIMWWTATDTYITSPTGYSSYESAYDKTLCSINIPGPAHS
jgi:prepilin-type N-terminal cleavage/methylation domain-containing protein